jgi:SRSO17 transposase
MDAEQIRQLKPRLNRFLKQFADCFGRKDTRAHLPVYVRGQLSNLPDKSVEPLAEEAGVAPRTLQEFLSHLKWDHDRMRDRVQDIARTQHSGNHTLAIFDETSCAKKGTKTPGVQRQWCGSEGKKENCIVTVHLGYACGDFHALLDSELFLPESWSQDRKRCREAGIPDTLTYRPKWQIALELYDHARGNGLRFAWSTFDENYGGKPPFLQSLEARGQRFVGEVPRTFTGWLKAPRVVQRRHCRGGRPRRVPRLATGSSRARSVEKLLNHRALRKQPWRSWRSKDSDKGPVLWEIKQVPFYAKQEDGLASGRWHLIIARNLLDRKEVKFFVSNAPPETPLPDLLLVGFSRWHVERCFEDQKGEVGLDHYEGRKYLGLKRHLMLSAVSYLFLAQTRQGWGEKSRADRKPSAYCHRGLDPFVVVESAYPAPEDRTPRQKTRPHATAQRPGPQESPENGPTPSTRVRAATYRNPTLSLEWELAL